MKKYLLILSIFTFTIGAWAQKTWTADIEPVTLSGYYNIELDQHLVGGASSNFSDLRILTTKDGGVATEVPYFVRSVSPVEATNEFETYKLKENSVKDSLNVIVVDNSVKEMIDRFYVVYKNADVKIDMAIRGSDNLKQWYVVKKKGSASNFGSSQGTDAVLILDLPKGDYKYYEIALSNDQQSPLDVRFVGKMNSSSIYGQFVELNVGQFVQKEDKENHTILSFPQLTDAYKISKLEIAVDDKVVYLRNAEIRDSLTYNRSSIRLSSKSDNTFFLDDFKMQNSTTINIDNRDNPPLKVTSVRVYGLKRFICAHLDSEKKYSIAIDAGKYTFPSYDIQQFKNDLAVDLMEVATNNVKSEKIEIEANVRERMFIEEPIVLWSVIIGLGLFLTFICVKMVKKMKEDEK